MFIRCIRCVALITLICAVLVPQIASSQSATAQTNPASVAINRTNIVRYMPGMTMQSLANRPNTDLVELKNGHHVTVGDVRRLDAIMQRLRAPRADKTPAAFKLKPAPTGIPIRNRADLATALSNRHDSDTVQLPSGRRVTIGLIKEAQPLVQQRLGYKLTDLLQQPNLSGPSIKISKTTPKSDWQNIAKKPDSAVLELPDGKRFTVGQLRQVAAKYAQGRRPMRQMLPAKTAPTGTLQLQPQKGGVR